MHDVHAERITSEFLEFVRIDSPSGHEAAIAAFLEQRLRELGLETRNDGSGPSTGNIIARWAATGPGESLLLTAHMDTVEPGRGVNPKVVDGVVQTDGRTILGADCKAGLAAILEGLRLISESGAPHPLVEVVITWGEEVGHLGARALDFSGFASQRGLCLDALCPVGTIVNSAPGYDRITAILRGRGAHAGAEPELGVSAIVAAAHALTGLRLGRIDDETTANIGLIRGGTARNAVPAEAVLEGEARSRDPQKLQAQVAQMCSQIEAGARAAGATVEVIVEHDYLPYTVAPDSPVAQLAVRAGRRAGFEPRFMATGGGSDANNFNVAGLPMVVLGIGCQGAHTVDERLSIAELAGLARYVVASILEAGQPAR